MARFFEQIISNECDDFSVIIEDDGQVCYAYLLQGKSVKGDVWLYNQAESPLNIDFSDKDGLPFLNPIEYIKCEEHFQPLLAKHEVNVKWIFTDKNNCELQEAHIFIRNRLTAIMKSGSKPGWSVNAKKDGPLAKALIND